MFRRSTPSDAIRGWRPVRRQEHAQTKESSSPHECVFASSSARRRRRGPGLAAWGRGLRRHGHGRHRHGADRPAGGARQVPAQRFRARGRRDQPGRRRQGRRQELAGGAQGLRHPLQRGGRRLGDAAAGDDRQDAGGARRALHAGSRRRIADRRRLRDAADRHGRDRAEHHRPGQSLHVPRQRQQYPADEGAGQLRRGAQAVAARLHRLEQRRRPRRVERHAQGAAEVGRDRLCRLLQRRRGRFLQPHRQHPRLRRQGRDAADGRGAGCARDQADPRRRPRRRPDRHPGDGLAPVSRPAEREVSRRHGAVQRLPTQSADAAHQGVQRRLPGAFRRGVARFRGAVL